MYHEQFFFVNLYYYFFEKNCFFRAYQLETTDNKDGHRVACHLDRAVLAGPNNLSAQSRLSIENEGIHLFFKLLYRALLKKNNLKKE